jgi:hypothetical protein
MISLQTMRQKVGIVIIRHTLKCDEGQAKAKLHNCRLPSMQSKRLVGKPDVPKSRRDELEGNLAYVTYVNRLSSLRS